MCILAKQTHIKLSRDRQQGLPAGGTAQHGTAVIQVDRNGEADLYEAQGQAMCFLGSLDAVNDEQAAGSALQGTHIQQGFQQSPGGAHSGKQGRPHLSVCLARHTDHNVPEQREVADELRCSLKEWPCDQQTYRVWGSKPVAVSLANLAWCRGCNKPVVAALTGDTPKVTKCCSCRGILTSSFGPLAGSAIS